MSYSSTRHIQRAGITNVRKTVLVFGAENIFLSNESAEMNESVVRIHPNILQNLRVSLKSVESFSFTPSLKYQFLHNEIYM
jgi:hypothetical protein